MKKRKLAVLFGGCSSEYDISLQSAHAVLTHLDPEKYEPVPLGITRDGRWFLYQGPFDALLDDSWHTDERHLVPAVISPDRGVHGLLLIAPAGPNRYTYSAAFPVLHAKTERTAPSRACWSCRASPSWGAACSPPPFAWTRTRPTAWPPPRGWRCPPPPCFRAGEDMALLPERTAGLTYPLFVKPARAGSSFGISKVDSPEALSAAWPPPWSTTARW